MKQSPAPILLVEDNSDDIFFMQRACREAAMARPLKVVEDGSSAIEFLSRGGEENGTEPPEWPCLVLLDLKLPQKSGLEVLRWIRESELVRALPVIIVTTSAERSDVDEAYRLGANGYLVKPANLNELVVMLKALKNYWFDFNLLPTVGEKRAGSSSSRPG